MFSFGSGKGPHPTGSAATAPRKLSYKRDSPPSSLRSFLQSPDLLEPAIDGPPSPERIRAYTEQMKRSSIFGNITKTHTLSSGASSSPSRDSAPDHVKLSRHSSVRSNGSSMNRQERPESTLGALLSRSSRKSKKAAHTPSLRSAPAHGLDKTAAEEASVTDHYYEKDAGSRRWQYISSPYNFRHITHTLHDHFPDLGRTSGAELASEFSAIRASQVPTRGELRGIRAEQLHFENFSSAEDLRVLPCREAPASPRQSHRRVLRKSAQSSPRSPRSPRSPKRPMGVAKSHDNLRVAPQRPPRSPVASPNSLSFPGRLPARTSSRVTSPPLDMFDPPATRSIAHARTNGGFRKPAPFALPVTPPATDELQGESTHAVTTPGEEAWPLTASLSGNFGAELADVQEEDDAALKRRSRRSATSAELRTSLSVPALRCVSQQQSSERSESRTSATLGHSPTKNEFSVAPALPAEPALSLGDSWESDIDWCYENEVEATCEFQWDPSQHPMAAGDGSIEDAASTTSSATQPTLQLRVQTEERTYRGRFRPSLLASSAFEPPELSPRISNASTTSDPRTPSNFLTTHVRSGSPASSFKESHGFNLSPTLLIPTDFHSQMEQDALYSEHYNDSSNGAIFVHEPYVHVFSPIDEGGSSTSSYRSSDYSRRSTRSSSSTRTSGMSRASHDSMMFSRSSSVRNAHRSVSSTSSLPDLIPSTLRQIDHDLSAHISEMTFADEIEAGAPSPGLSGPNSAHASVQHRRNRQTVLERECRNGEPQLNTSSSVAQKSDAVDILSPVAEAFPPVPPRSVTSVHGRNTSAPEAVAPIRESKGRARASTATSTMAGGRRRGSYMLFPQI
ncbi:hypothetical protein PZA11_002330 [Diplocarpon coronariae]|uniref:CRIB domain-containing protein n=1 Tax=Diplocarpon coronariae TaxID=2795749 RepID=A0A218YU75_9HELO|nr:hypothetical protein JHW43_007668 [Diplocarpon mali]OWO98486.1 hypothetical protein B2J93_2221 [Marssonina coronariae]